MGKVLEIGTGSGYQTSVLARMVRRVYTIERHRELMIEHGFGEPGQFTCGEKCPARPRGRAFAALSSSSSAFWPVAVVVISGF